MLARPPLSVPLEAPLPSDPGHPWATRLHRRKPLCGHYPQGNRPAQCCSQQALQMSLHGLCLTWPARLVPCSTIVCLVSHSNTVGWRVYLA